jgi:hypothetical protein
LFVLWGLGISYLATITTKYRCLGPDLLVLSATESEDWIEMMAGMDVRSGRTTLFWPYKIVNALYASSMAGQLLRTFLAPVSSMALAGLQKHSSAKSVMIY